MAIPFPIISPFFEQIGGELQRFADGEAEITMDVVGAHTNSFGVAHGGMLMTLLDVAMAHAARSLVKGLPGGGPGWVTIEMKTTFMRPGLGHITAVGKVLHSTANLAFCEGKVMDRRGRVCAHATATFKCLGAVPSAVRGSAQVDDPRIAGQGSD